MVDLNNQENIFVIVQFIEDEMLRTEVDEKIFSIMEEEIKKHVIEKLSKEIISDRAFKISCERIPPINIFKLVNKRLSKLYSDPPQRKAIPKADQSLVLSYEKNACINSIMNICQVMTSAHRRSAIEPFLDRKTPQLRVIPANQFLVYSLNNIDRTKEDVFIKFAGTTTITKIDDEGNSFQTDIPIFHLYNDHQFTIIDSEGNYRTELMVGKNGQDLKLDGNVLRHSFKRIPIVYVNNSHFELMPAPNTDDVELSLLILTLLTDLNYAVKYQAHSMIYMINVDSEKIDMNPDAILDLKSDGDEGEKSEVGTVKPTVDIPGTLQLLSSTLKLYLESKGLKIDINATINSDKAESGIHETIKNATLIEERKDQIFLYRKVEKSLWGLIALKHNKWVSKGLIKKSMSSQTFDNEFEIEIFYEEQKPVVSRRDKGLMLQSEIDARLTSQKKGMKELKPELTDTEIDEEIKQIEEEQIKNKAVESQIKMNENNKQLAEEKRNKDQSNDRSTSQNENPNKR